MLRNIERSDNILLLAVSIDLRLEHTRGQLSTIRELASTPR